ncbi:MAG: transposase [Polyangia bacterium]
MSEDSYSQENQINFDQLRRFWLATGVLAALRGIDRLGLTAYLVVMFRPTSPQLGLFSVGNRLDETKRARLQKSWAHQFRCAALQLIDEDRFAKFFDKDNGRPNKSVRQVVGVLVLKDVFDLTDEQALEQLEWNAAWHYALDVLPEEAHACQKTLHNYRELLLQDGEGSGLFESMTGRLLAAAGLNTRRQRQDSTHILSNIRLLTRLGLFVQTITQFLERLRGEHPRLCGEVVAELRERYLDREGYFADARSSEAPRRLAQTALDVYHLVRQFADHRSVSGMEAFALLQRLYNDQCVPPTTEVPIQIELQERPSSSSLQSPSDPDVTYGHKGKGYEAQLVETCGEDNPFEVVTAVSVNGSNESDQQHVLPILDQVARTCGTTPETLHTDAGYASGENIVGAEKRGTDLRAPIGSKGPSEESASVGDFDFDETRTTVLTCPMGEAPVAHERPGKLTILAIFSGERCDACPFLDKCPVQRRGDRLVFPFRIADVAVAQRRQDQATPEFKEQHKIRSGIEATNSELKRCHGFGKLRVRGRPRVTLAVHLKVLALNVKRYVGHLAQAAVATADPVPTCAC